MNITEIIAKIAEIKRLEELKAEIVAVEQSLARKVYSYYGRSEDMPSDLSIALMVADDGHLFLQLDSNRYVISEEFVNAPEDSDVLTKLAKQDTQYKAEYHQKRMLSSGLNVAAEHAVQAASFLGSLQAKLVDIGKDVNLSIDLPQLSDVLNPAESKLREMAAAASKEAEELLQFVAVMSLDED